MGRWGRAGWAAVVIGVARMLTAMCVALRLMWFREKNTGLYPKDMNMNDLSLVATHKLNGLLEVLLSVLPWALFREGY